MNQLSSKPTFSRENFNNAQQCFKEPSRKKTGRSEIDPQRLLSLHRWKGSGRSICKDEIGFPFSGSF